MPHRANAARRHHIPRPKRRVANWAEYDASLRLRGGPTVWGSDEAIRPKTDSSMLRRTDSLALRVAWRGIKLKCDNTFMLIDPLSF